MTGEDQPLTPTYILTRDAGDPKAFSEAVWGRVFNRRRDTSRVPRAVVQASCVAHVREAVELASREQCRVSVRSGGHSWAAWSVRQDAVLVDLGGLRHMAYDERTKIVSCSPSATGEQVNRLLREEGRMFAGGHCPDVGLGGFLLQGGSKYCRCHILIVLAICQVSTFSHCRNTRYCIHNGDG